MVQWNLCISACTCFPQMVGGLLNTYHSKDYYLEGSFAVQSGRSGSGAILLHPKHQYRSTKLHSVKTQKMEFHIYCIEILKSNSKQINLMNEEIPL